MIKQGRFIIIISIIIIILIVMTFVIVGIIIVFIIITIFTIIAATSIIINNILKILISLNRLDFRLLLITSNNVIPTQMLKCSQKKQLIPVFVHFLN